MQFKSLKIQSCYISKKPEKPGEFEYAIYRLPNKAILLKYICFPELDVKKIHNNSGIIFLTLICNLATNTFICDYMDHFNSSGHEGNIGKQHW